MAGPPRLAFAGTPDFAVPALEALVGAGCPPLRVLTQPDRPAGRGRRLRRSAVKVAAERHVLPVMQPQRLDRSVCDELAALDLDALVVVAYGLLLPPAVLALPRRGCINIHASLLPRWRGAAPIQRAMLAGDVDTGVCLMRMDSGLDTGPVLARGATPIHDHDTAGTLHDRLAGIGAGLLLRWLPAILEGRIEPQPQVEARATHAPKLSKSEARIDWCRDACALRRQVAAFNPWPVAETCWRDGTLRIWRAEVAGSAPAGADLPGRVVAAGRDGIVVQCGRGRLRILELQPAGARRMTAETFLNGRALVAGDRLG